MKRIATFILLAALAVGATVPVYAQRENRSIGENSREAKKAAKQQRKYVNKNAKKQRKAMKKYQKAQRQQGKNPAAPNKQRSSGKKSPEIYRPLTRSSEKKSTLGR